MRWPMRVFPAIVLLLTFSGVAEENDALGGLRL